MQQNISNMSKSTHFFGQPVYGQLIKCLDKNKINTYSRQHGGERYVKKFDMWSHVVTMLYAVVMRFDSLREIQASMLAESRKLPHLSIDTLPKRSTLSDANKRRPEELFGWLYMDVLEAHRDLLFSDSQRGKGDSWLNRLKIMDSTTIPLFSNLVFKGVGRNPKHGKKKGGIKVHTIINANEGVPYDMQFTSAATHDSFMMAPQDYSKNDILAIDRAYIDYVKFEQMTHNGAVYVTKMKKNLVYQLEIEYNITDDDSRFLYNIKEVVLKKKGVEHHARIVTYIDHKKTGKNKTTKLISLLTNDFEMDAQDIVAIYRKRWQIESLFKQVKQNFPLRYFYGETANAIKIQIWMVFLANLLITIVQRRIKRSWSFSGLATMIRIVLMYYINMESFFEQPENDWKKYFSKHGISPPQCEENV